jgi:dTDP-4-amino-4,6-dideoxygalactose transaminase
MKTVTVDGNRITFDEQVFNMIDNNVINNIMTIKLEPIEDLFFYRGKVYNIIDKKITGTSSREMISDTVRNKTIFAFLPIWIERNFDDKRSAKLSWLKKVTLVQRYYFTSYTDTDPQTGNRWWDDYKGEWITEDIIK